MSIPNARLLLKSKQLESEPARDAVEDRFRRAGLDTARLSLEGESPFADYLASFSRVDIALDPFPYTGGTTTIHALWMGVPVITLTGDRLLARQSSSMLRAMELDDWVANSEEEYLGIARHWAGSIDRLEALRVALRGRLEASPLMDARRFAEALRGAFKEMWARRCDQVAEQAGGVE
jgi:predicted O-linked N-acetylglucosamine transferase (SPINDLY family)